MNYFTVVEFELRHYSVMQQTADNLNELYEDVKGTAKLIGLGYIEGNPEGIARLQRGKGFSYTDSKGTIVTSTAIKKRITELVIPPAWKEVWICPDDTGHVLATGIDEKGRKQYIYHPKWRSMRDLIKFYRMIAFAKVLPLVRKTIDTDLQRPQLDRPKVMAVMLWLLDNTYIRIGNDQYFTANESVGLTTLSDKHLVVAGTVITLAFRGKSGKDQQITFENEQIAAIIEQLIKQRGERLFRYKNEDGSFHNIESSDINSYLQELTGAHISAKDFRTWGGTLLAFDHLVETEKLPAAETPNPEKVTLEAIDAAANVLGNTRSVARSSYVHPDILSVYSNKHFAKYYDKAHAKRAVPGLDKRESELLGVLELLFDSEFKILKKS